MRLANHEADKWSNEDVVRCHRSYQANVIVWVVCDGFD